MSYRTHLARRDEYVTQAAETAAAYRERRDKLRADPAYSEDGRAELIGKARSEAEGAIAGHVESAHRYHRWALDALNEVGIPAADPADRARVAAALAAGRDFADLVHIASASRDAATLLALRAEAAYLTGDVDVAAMVAAVDAGLGVALPGDQGEALAARCDAIRSWAVHEIALNAAQAKLETGLELGDVIAQRTLAAAPVAPVGAGQ